MSQATSAPAKNEGHAAAYRPAEGQWPLKGLPARSPLLLCWGLAQGTVHPLRSPLALIKGLGQPRVACPGQERLTSVCGTGPSGNG